MPGVTSEIQVTEPVDGYPGRTYTYSSDRPITACSAVEAAAARCCGACPSVTGQASVAGLCRAFRFMVTLCSSQVFFISNHYWPDLIDKLAVFVLPCMMRNISTGNRLITSGVALSGI